MTRKPLLIGLMAGGIRALLGGLLMLLCLLYPETHLLALADFLTLGTYWILTLAGVELAIEGAFETRFLLIGITTWFVAGIFLGFLFHHTARRRLGAASE
jgi:hypothetical protein